MNRYKFQTIDLAILVESELKIKDKIVAITWIPNTGNVLICTQVDEETSDTEKKKVLHD